MLAKNCNNQPPRATAAPGFSLLEILATILVLGCVAAMVIERVSMTSTTISSTKLTSDVKKLNEIVAVYLASGGSLAGLTTPQQVLNQLKTVANASTQSRQVSVMTGRGVDVREVATMQSTSDAQTNSLRAIWNSATNQFVLATSGTSGVASFDLNPALAAATPTTDTTRANSNELYNGAAGWVWAPGNNVEAALPAPTTVALTNTSVTSSVDPTVTTSTSSTTSSSTTTGTSSTATSTSTSGTSSSSSSSTSSSTGTSGSPSGSLPHGGTPGVLPTPVITTAGGDFSSSNYPNQVFIDPNAAPAAVSTLEYQINGGAWTVYTAPIVVPSGSTVIAKNVSTNTSLYTNSGTDTESYYIIQAWFGGSLTAKWNASTGPSGFTSTINNTNPLSVTETDGIQASGYTDGNNSFNFYTSGAFSNIQPNTNFPIGTIVYHNGTINSGSGSTGLTLELDITMGTPAIATTACNIQIALSNSANSGNGNNAQSADTATLSDPVTDYAVNVNGVTYTLVVAYGSIDSSQGYVSGNTLNVWEGATGTCQIIASFISNH